MKAKTLKLFSWVAIIISLCLLGFFLMQKPQTPKANTQEDVFVDLSQFSADTSKLNLPDTMHLASVKKYDGLYYIADAIAKRVYCVDENSNIIWESQGIERFILPNAKFPLDISDDGKLWVANTGKHRLEQLDLKTGKFIASWQPTNGFKGCCNPVAILALSEGRFLAMEKGVNTLSRYYPDGSGEILAKLKSNWANFELRKSSDKIEYCDGRDIKTL